METLTRSMIWRNISDNSTASSFLVSGNESSSIPRIVMRLKRDGYLDYSGFELDNPPKYDPFEWETIDWKSSVTWVHRHWDLPIYVGVIYLITIFGIQSWMRERKAFSLKGELFLWNAALGLFSILGFVRMLPEFLGLLSAPNGFFNSICVFQGGNMPTAFWGIVFAWSKFVELGDTVFIVLRKKPLQLLQWYHHLITLSVCWWTLPYVEPISRYYCIMNYGVHSLMYPYFAARALDIKVPRGLANVITTLQLGQMIVGLGVNTYSSLVFHFGGGSQSCFRHPNSVQMFSLVYGSFALLFGQLFWKLVIQPGRRRANSQKVNQDKKQQSERVKQE